MGASQDKRKRREDRAAGIVDRKDEQRRIEEDKNSKERKRWIGGTIVGAIVVVALFVLNSGLFYNVMSSVTIGNTEYTNAEFQYYFASAYSNYYYFVDMTVGLDEQPSAFDPEQTWEQYLTTLALDEMKSVTASYEAALAAGYTLTDEDKATVDSDIASLEANALMSGYSNVDGFLAANFGKGSDEDTIRTIMERSALATRYESDMYESYTFTDEEIAAHYDENEDNNDKYEYSYFLLSAAMEETTVEPAEGEATTTDAPTVTQAVTEETMAEAKDAADDIADEVSDIDSFTEALAALGAEPVSEENVSGASLNASFADWIKDSSREAGDVTVIEVPDSGYYIVLFEGREDNRYNTVAVRHVLINVEDTDGDGTMSDEEYQAAEDRINEIQVEFEATDMSEDSFAQIANLYSEDGGSNTTGGLYEDIYKGQMVEPFNDFIFEEGREPGDTGIVFNEGSYTGYHLIYFVGEGEEYRGMIADSELKTESYTAWREELIAPYTYSTKFPFSLADIG